MTQEQLTTPAIPSCTLEVAADLLNTAPLMAHASMEVKSEADQEIALAHITEIKGRKKALEAEFEKRWGNEKRALKKLLKMITDYEKTIVSQYVTPIIAVADALNKRIVGFWKEREADLQKQAEAEHAKRIAEEKASREAAMKTAVLTGDEKAVKEVAQRDRNLNNLENKEVKVSQTIRTSGGTLAQVKVWKWKLVDKSIVPDEYLILDEKKLNAMAKKRSKEVVNCPGIEFYQETRTSLRS